MADSSKNASPQIDGYKEEIEVVASEPRNWKGIIIALLVILSICSLILIAIIILSPHLISKIKNERLKLEDVLLDEYTRKVANETWISNEEIVYRDPDGSVMLHNVRTQWNTILASNASLSHVAVERYSLSADQKFILLLHDVLLKNTYSVKAKYKVYDTRDGQISDLDIQTTDNEFDHVEWGPSGSQMVLISENNIIYVPSFGERPQQLTNSGTDGFISNGIPDLMYEEFIMYSNKALWWTFDGSKLCFATFDNSRVEQMPVVFYGYNFNVSEHNYSQNTAYETIYPKVVSYPYPKPGRNNPLVTLWVSDLNAPVAATAKQITPPREVQQWEYYITAVRWINNSRIAVVWTRRSHNVSVITVCAESGGWRCEKLHEEQLHSPKGWLQINEAPHFSDDSRYFFMKLPVADGSVGTYDQVAMITIQGSQKYFLTHGQFTVTKILGYKSDENKVYFVATSVDDPGERHIYSVTHVDVKNPRQLKCLSCQLNVDCKYYDAVLSPTKIYYLLHCLGPNIPRTELRRVENNELISVFNDFPHIKERNEQKTVPKIRYLKIPLSSGYFARVKLILPQFLQEDSNAKFPVVVHVDNKPGSQSVNYENSLDWGHYLASKRDYVVIHMDVRGSGFQGNKFMHEIYHQLGEHEAQDIISVIKFLKQRLSYIDHDKIAVWGKEFGGYLVTSLLIRDPTFNCGIAVSPVVSWRNYMSAFVERYMGFPSQKENYVNYDKSDLIRNVAQIKEKEFLIVHGTADRKVNIQHSMLLMKALTDRGVAFKLQLYPDGDHSLHEQSTHLLLTMEDFFSKCFQLEDEEDEKEIELPITKVIKGGKRIITGED